MRGTKTLRVAAMTSRSPFRLLEEIKKCDVVCANCHTTRTYLRRIGTSRARKIMEALK